MRAARQCAHARSCASRNPRTAHTQAIRASDSMIQIGRWCVRLCLFVCFSFRPAGAPRGSQPDLFVSARYQCARARARVLGSLSASVYECVRAIALSPPTVVKPTRACVCKQNTLPAPVSRHVPITSSLFSSSAWRFCFGWKGRSFCNRKNEGHVESKAIGSNNNV